MHKCIFVYLYYLLLYYCDMRGGVVQRRRVKRSERIGVSLSWSRTRSGHGGFVATETSLQTGPGTWSHKVLSRWYPNRTRDMEPQGAESAAEAAIVKAMRLICQTRATI